jgi:DNA polymerase-3 subunit delta
MPAIRADAFLADPPDTILSAAAILIAGDETYLIDKVLDAVLARVVTVPGAEAFDVDKRDAAELDPADYESLVATMPLMNDRRVVVLKGVQEVPGEVRDRIKATLDERPAELCLIGTGAATMRGTLYQEWEKKGARIVCELPRKARSKQPDFDFARWLVGRARADFGKVLDREAAEALAELGGDLGSLHGELEKAALHAGASDSVTRADVEAVCIGCAAGNVWEWCDAVGSRDTTRALGLLRTLLDAGETAYRLVPLLATHFCRLGVVVGLPRKDSRAIMEALPGRSWPAMAAGLATQAQRHSPESVARALDLLAEADLMLKSSGYDEEFVLHKHLIEILEAA